MEKRLAVLGEKIYFVKIFSSHRMILKPVGTIGVHNNERYVSILKYENTSNNRKFNNYFPILTDEKDLLPLLRKHLPKKYRCDTIVYNTLIS